MFAGQYESWTNPIAVILSLPTAILGTVLGCIVMSLSISIYSQIGLILLIALSAKNAILIIEFAMDYRKQGASIRQSAMEAAPATYLDDFVRFYLRGSSADVRDRCGSRKSYRSGYGCRVRYGDEYGIGYVVRS